MSSTTYMTLDGSMQLPRTVDAARSAIPPHPPLVVGATPRQHRPPERLDHHHRALPRSASGLQCRAGSAESSRSGMSASRPITTSTEQALERTGADLQPA